MGSSGKQLKVKNDLVQAQFLDRLIADSDFKKKNVAKTKMILLFYINASHSNLNITTSYNQNDDLNYIISVKWILKYRKFY